METFLNLPILAWGVDVVVAVQAWGAWLEVPMALFSFLGTENFFLFVLPLLYWCVDQAVGLRVGLVLIGSITVNAFFKLLWTGPRPYWVSATVVPLAGETTFGVPSGHSQNAVAMWGILAAAVRRPWAWGVAVALAVGIGVSRLYLGVHFPHDVLLGWSLGALVLVAFLLLQNPVEAWLKTRSLGVQVALAFAASLAVIAAGTGIFLARQGFALPADWAANALRVGELPHPVELEGFLTAAGILFGLTAGAAWMAAQGGFDARGALTKRAARYVLGLFGVAVLWLGLGLVFPDNGDALSFVLRYVRYALVGVWVSAAAPWLFIKLKVAQSAVAVPPPR